MEVELKFQVPAERAAALRRAVATSTAQTTRLQAVYVDTHDQRLAAAGLALRLRKEGRQWVQTLKGRGDGLLQRLEHEVPVAAAAIDPRQPFPDPARHAGTEAGALLEQALGHTAVDLRLLYRTDIQRLHRRVRHAGALIEIAYDQGHLYADGRKAAVDEIEFELLSGPPAALPALALRWVERFDLWWDCRTKSERGMRLALGTVTVPATHALATQLSDDAGPGEVGAAGLHAALRQALPNAAELASGTGGPEHLHQLRVALRRLRTVLRMWAPWLPEPEAAHLLEQAWKGPFGVLGEVRDADVQSTTLWPELLAAGAPEIEWPAAQAIPDAGVCVREPAFTRLLLQTLTLALRPAVPYAEPAAQAAREVLAPAWRDSVRDAARFAQADIAAQHRTRKRLKRLRYLIEVLQPLFKPRATKALLKSVRRALNALGDLNDLHAAELLYRKLAETDPRAWFAVGWLAARREPAQARAAEVLSKLKGAPTVWRKQ